MGITFDRDYVRQGLRSTVVPMVSERIGPLDHFSYAIKKTSALSPTGQDYDSPKMEEGTDAFGKKGK